MVEETTLQFVAILITVTGLLAWVLKIVIKHFIDTARERASYIEKLVDQNQANTEKFTDTINHQRTQDRDMQNKHLEVIQRLEGEMNRSNQVNEKMLTILSNSIK